MAPTIMAVVEAVNDKGIQVHGDGLNVSQLHPVALPMRGALVSVEVHEGGGSSGSTPYSC